MYMKKTSLWLILFLVVLFLVITAQPALAAPGGKIVSGLFKSAFGKVLLVIVFFVFLPIIVYTWIKEKSAEENTLKQLDKLAAIDPNFDWIQLRKRITDCFNRVHAAWRAEDMSVASQWMTSWYWQNQQLVYLNQWAQRGLVNYCHVKIIRTIRPLHLKYQPNDNGTSDGSRLVVSITANMEDFLADRTTGKIVEGAKGYDDTEHVWTFILQDHRWVVENIEEGSTSLTYAQLPPEVPDVLPGKPAIMNAFSR